MNSDSLERALQKLLASVTGPDPEAVRAAETRQGRLAKPPGSLGKLEELSVKLAGITGSVKNELRKRRLFVFAADNGVVREGVAAAPQSVTWKQTLNLTRARTGASVLCRAAGSEITVVDVGVNADLPAGSVLDRKLMRGTGDIAEGPAMSRETAVKAVLTGAELAASSDADVIGVGEMGIGNTTTSAAVLSAFLGLDPEKTAGRGGGLTEEGLLRKREVIRRALSVNRPDPSDPVDVLSKVGGLDIAAMCGAFLGAASSRKPAVIDGFISAVSALAAYRLCPQVRAYLIPSHASAEAGFRLAMEEMDLRPFLLLDMRLGEGSGCPIAFQILDDACAVMNHMATFEEAGIEDGYLDEIRREEENSRKDGVRREDATRQE